MYVLALWRWLWLLGWLGVLAAGPSAAQETAADIVEISGEVVYLPIEGGFYGIISSNGQRYLPDAMPPDFAQAGLQVRARLKLRRNRLGFRMWGQPVEILDIRRLILPLAASPPDAADNSPPPITSLRLPPGFHISVYADNVINARSLALGKQGTVFVGTRKEGKVYALRDEDQDGDADKLWLLAEGLNMPNGVAFRDGALYIAEVNRILRLDAIEDRLSNPPQPVVVNDSYPGDTAHGWKFIAFGPDGKLYVPVGAPCNVCVPGNPIYASITRLNADGSEREIFAKGVRNSVGFDWHPQTGELWFTDNGRDWLGDDLPSDELNHAPSIGLDFGFPYCHQGDTPDPDHGGSCDKAVPPALKLGAHVAGLGMRFYSGEMFPPEYRNRIFIAQHGSWNRSQPVGYRVMMATLEQNRVVAYEPFAEGWLQDGKAWGRPVDVLALADGSVLISDDAADKVYRVIYKQPDSTAP
jgi:glucose/arabinose dehydrogenase